jgi:hypothetical protein
VTIATGQTLDSLSAGERQRLLLAKHLSDNADTADTATLRIVFDEPTAGLHIADVDRMLAPIDDLVDQGRQGRRGRLHLSAERTHPLESEHHRPLPREGHAFASQNGIADLSAIARTAWHLSQAVESAGA